MNSLLFFHVMSVLRIIDDVLVLICELLGVLYTGDSLRLIICACHS
jgi:hypothetical protein